MESTDTQQEALQRKARAGDASAELALANLLLSKHRFNEAEHRRGLDLLNKAMEGPLAAQAHWFHGAYRLQVPVEPGSHRLAFRSLQVASRAGLAGARDRLADLLLAGLGTERRPREAMALLQSMADQGNAFAAWQVGYLHAQEPFDAQDDSAHCMARACALAYPPAFYSLGLRFLLGAGAPVDSAFGRALLMRAADGGFGDALAAAEELTGGLDVASEASEWHVRLKENLAAAQPLLRELPSPERSLAEGVHPAVSRLESHLASIGHPALVLGPGGRLRVAAAASGSMRAAPAPLQWLSQAPRVALSRGFANREERAHLIAKVARSLTVAARYRKKSSANDDAETLMFDGEGHAFGALQSDAVVRALEHRLREMTGWTPAAMEPCSIIRYRPGQQYQPHVDSFSAAQIQRNSEELGDHGGQRIATFLVYLTAPEAGGETVYEQAGLEVRGEAGMGVLHYNVTPDGAPDPASLHSGKPVVSGEKWLWRSTLREHSLYPGHE